MCNGCNTCCNGTTWNNGWGCSYGCGYGNGLLNTLFDNGTQFICRDACGNIRVRTGTNTCGCCQNTCHCCQHTCGCCQCNGNDTGATENGNGNGNTDNGFYCITRCGNWQTTQATAQTTDTTDYNGFGRCSRRCGYNYYNG